MTTEKLVGLLAAYKSFGGTKVQFSPDEVMFAGTHAQLFILSNLRLLEQTVQLALAAAQERYYFTPVVITGIAINLAGNVVLTFADHVFHTDDEVVIDASTMRRYIVGTVTPTTIELLDSSVTGTILVIGNTVYHGLYAAVQVLDDGILKVSAASGPQTGTLEKATKAMIELEREGFTDKSPTREVIRFYQEFTDPLTIGVQGIPQEAIKTRVSFQRRPLPMEKVSLTVNPMVPYTHDYLLIVATRYFMYDFHEEEKVNDGAANELKKLNGMMEAVRNQQGKARLARKTGGSSFKFE